MLQNCHKIYMHKVAHKIKVFYIFCAVFMHVNCDMSLFLARHYQYSMDVSGTRGLALQGTIYSALSDLSLKWDLGSL